MMPIHHASMPILAAAAAEVVVTILWYSDHLFGPMWKKAGGKAAKSKDLYQKLAMHGIAALVTATALFIATCIFHKTQIAIYGQGGFGKIFGAFLDDTAHNNSLVFSLKTAGFLWLGFFLPGKFVSTVWSEGSWSKMGIESGGQLVSLLTMAAVIASLS